MPMSEKERQTLAAIIRFFCLAKTYHEKKISCFTGLWWDWKDDQGNLRCFDSKIKKFRLPNKEDEKSLLELVDFLKEIPRDQIEYVLQFFSSVPYIVSSSDKITKIFRSPY